MTATPHFSRRSVLTLAGGAALAATPLACGGAAGKGGYGQAKGKVPDKYAKRTHLVMWSAYGATNGDVFAELTNRFNAAQNDIYAEVQFQGGYDDTLQKTTAAVQAKRIPDLVTFSEVTWHDFYLNDLLEPLDSYFDKGFSKSVYNDELLNEGVLKGRTWWLPFARSTPMFYYNKTLFRKAGLPETAPKTWDEWHGYMKQLKGLKVNGKPVKLECYAKVDGDWEFQGSVWQWGGDYSKGLEVTINRPEAVAAAEWQRTLIHEDKMAYMADDISTDFGNQLVASIVQSTAGLRGITEVASKGHWEVGTAFVPKMKDQAVPTGGGGLSILAYASKERKQAAWEFIKFLGKPESSAYWTINTGYMPVVKKATEVPDLATLMKKDANFTTSVKQLSIVRKEDEVRLTVPDVNEMIYTGLQKIWGGNQPAQQVFDGVAKQMTKATDNIKKEIEKRT